MIGASKRVAARPVLAAGAFILSVLFAAGAAHLLFPDLRQNWKQVRLGPSFVYAYNTDSGEYARLVATFPYGFQTGYIRIVRPLYPALGFVIYQPLRLLRARIPESLCDRIRAVLAQGDRPEVWAGVDPRDLVAAWVALVILNVAMYVAAFGLALRFLCRVFPFPVAVVLASCPAAHQNTIDALLTPGADPLNVLLPAIFLFTLADWVERRPGYLPALAFGVGLLGKGLVAPFGNWLYEHAVVRGGRAGLASGARCLVLAAAPLLVYLGMLKALGLPIYNHETTVYRQFVWIADYVREGRASAVPWRIWSNVVTHARLVVEGQASALGLCAVLACRKSRRTLALDAAVTRHLVVYVLCAAAFFSVGGILFDRFSVVYYPAVVVPLGVLAVRKSDRPAAWLLVGLAAPILVAIAPSLFGW